MLLVENAAIEVGRVPIDTNNAAVTGDYVSLKDFRHLTVIIQQGAWAGGTPAVTLKQATDVAGTSEKAAPIAKYWTKVGVTGASFAAPTDVVSDTFNLPAVANTITVIEIDSDQLDVSGGFDCVRLGVASPGVNADLICVTYVLTKPRYAQAILADPKVD